MCEYTNILSAVLLLPLQIGFLSFVFLLWFLWRWLLLYWNTKDPEWSKQSWERRTKLKNCLSEAAGRLERIAGRKRKASFFPVSEKTREGGGRGKRGVIFQIREQISGNFSLHSLLRLFKFFIVYTESGSRRALAAILQIPRRMNFSG